MFSAGLAMEKIINTTQSTALTAGFTARIGEKTLQSVAQNQMKNTGKNTILTSFARNS